MNLHWLVLLAQVKVTAKATLPDSLTVGDTFTVTVTVSSPPGMETSYPAPESLSGVVLIQSRQDTAAWRGDTSRRYYFKMAAFRPGTLQIPPFVVAFQQDSTCDTVCSQPVTLTVESVLPPNMTDINDIRPPFSPASRVWLRLLELLAAACGITALILLWLRRRNRVRAAPEPTLSPLEEALRALEGLPGASDGPGVEPREYYFQLSSILRQYLEREFLFPALGATTTEITRTLKARKVRHWEGISRFLGRADLVKFARLRPPDAELRSARETVRHLILSTRQEEGM